MAFLILILALAVKSKSLGTQEFTFALLSLALAFALLALLTLKRPNFTYQFGFTRFTELSQPTSMQNIVPSQLISCIFSSDANKTTR